ncbi:hypothetical protein GCM10025866_15460 [Naasia aerilata]|uniref:UDP-N-acetylenolpyruvoylglucosamine reductase n=1 Tax=Naasia aerilata TaxID=1162966 RepID=A0ABM8GBM3_9MICO|nr:hypothetical protein GCM10025866_15460 [Naasia aerilata]
MSSSSAEPEVREDVPLSTLTTLRVGGPARRVVRADSTGALIDAALATWADGDDWLVLGGGSNLLAGDDGFDGTVLLPAARGIEEQRDGDRVVLRVEAGEPWDDLVAVAVERGLTGIEALSGIPGSTGAAPIQNIGAYGQELSSSSSRSSSSTTSPASCRGGPRTSWGSATARRSSSRDCAASW